MKINLNKFIVVLFLLLAAKQNFFAQTLSVPNYTACPGQVVTIVGSWNNASNPSYSLYAPTNPPPNTPNATSGNPSFTTSIANPLPGVYNYTMIGNATVQGSQTTNTFVFQLTISPPPPMTLTNPQFYCNGTSIQITAPMGGSSYTYAGPAVSTTNTSSNIITIPNSSPSMTGNFTVTSVIGGCTVTGQTNVQVSPYKTLSISSTTNVCQGASPTLTANLPGGSGVFQWKDNLGNVISGVNGPSLPLTSVTIADQGVYRATTDDQFNGLSCPYTATTQVNVVQTSPVIPAANPSTLVCQGTNLILSASTVYNATFQWTGPSFSSNLASPSINPALPVNSGTYFVTAIFQGAFLSCPTSASISVTVIPVSIPVITMPSSVCQDAPLTATGSAGSMPTAFLWTGPLFAPSNNVNYTQNNSVANVSVVPSNASGTQYLTVKFGTNQQCSATASVQLNVIPVNTITVIPPGVVCAPSQVFLQALATGANNYAWTGPNGYVNQGPNVFIYTTTSPLLANGIYSVTATFGGGTSLLCTNENTVQVTVNVPLTFSLIPRQEVCYSTPVTITGPPGATSYTWTSSTGFTSNDKDVLFSSAQPINSGSYTLNINNGPCPSSANTELVVLTPLSFTLTPFDRTICRGDTIFLEAGATGGSETYAYTWNPAVYLESPTGPKQMAIPLGSVIYNLSVYDIACPNYTIAHPFNVTVNQPPIPNLQLTQSEGCVPLCLSIDPKLGKSSAITTYDFGGRRVFQHNDTTSKPFTYCLDEAGTYTLNIYTKGYNNCSNTYQYPFPLVVNPKPGSDIVWEPETPTTNDVLTFYPTFKSDWPITYTSWTFLGGVTEGDTTMANMPGVSDTTNVRNPTRAYTQIGSYPVVLIATNDRGCTDTAFKFVKIIDDLQIYIPNTFTPNDDGINDVFLPKGTGMKVENFTMDIFSRGGINIFTTKDVNQGWDGKVGGQFVRDATYIYKIKVVGMNGEGRKEYTGHVTVLK